MKRLYVRADYRGGGVGRQLMEWAIEAARALGYREMWLDTLPSLTAAQALYAQRGFREIAPYGGPAAPGTRYFGLHLAPRSLAGDAKPPEAS
jgi:GNAT superfamily N-acetyltransferase